MLSVYICVAPRPLPLPNTLVNCNYQFIYLIIIALHIATTIKDAALSQSTLILSHTAWHAYSILLTNQVLKPIRYAA